MDNENQPQERTCVCGSPMRHQGRQLLYLREPGFFHFESYADYVEVDLYICPQCRRGDFFFPADVISEKVEYSEANSRAFYREQYQNESTENLRKLLKSPYLPTILTETVREILDERSEETQSSDTEKPPRAEPWTKSEEKKGFSPPSSVETTSPKRINRPNFNEAPPLHRRRFSFYFEKNIVYRLKKHGQGRKIVVYSFQQVSSPFKSIISVIYIGFGTGGLRQWHIGKATRARSTASSAKSSMWWRLRPVGRRPIWCSRTRPM